jgi:hypothetical protein
MTKNPWKEAFLSENIIATIVVLGEGVVWYSGQFWPLYYLGTVVKLDPLATAYIVGGGVPFPRADLETLRALPRTAAYLLRGHLAPGLSFSRRNRGPGPAGGILDVIRLAA